MTKLHAWLCPIIFFISFTWVGCTSSPMNSRAPASPDPLSTPELTKKQTDDEKRSAEILIRQLESKFDARFSHRERETFATFEKRVRDRETGALSELFKSDSVMFGLRAFQKDRTSIARRGVLNQYVTHSSGAFYGMKIRAAAEARMLDLPLATFDSLSVNLKPKYGYLRAKDDNSFGIENHDAITDSYGEDIYIFRASSVAPRLSFSLGDSLSRLDNAPTGTNLSWEFMFIPWKYNALLVPAMSENVEITGQFYLGKGLVNDAFKRDLGFTMAHYIELQYWGPIDLDDVEMFYFTKNAPEGEFLESLIKRRIKVFKDTREEDGGQLTEWTPSKK